MGMKKKVELLAPAGNIEGFYGAVHAGADAVYLGGSRYGARAYAENFTTEDLVSCIRYAHILGRKVYLTVNTLMKEQELADLEEYLCPFYKAGLDAVIVQDMGAFRYIRERFPKLALHVSTQMTICDKHGAALLKEMGAERIVPARELSLEEIRSMKQAADIELETFIHGAMCYCYSGQCLFSSILGGRSGNRGRCAQPCRLPYSVSGAENSNRDENWKKGPKQASQTYPLSLKDMCTIEHIPDLIEAGIDSFKIEGRMKKSEYTAGVTAIYRKYIDFYEKLREKYGKEDAKSRYQVKAEDLKALSSLYIRSEIHDGYYYKHNGKEMVTLHDPAYSGSDEKLLAEIDEKYLKERFRLPVNMTAEFIVGEPAKLTLCTPIPEDSTHVTDSFAGQMKESRTGEKAPLVQVTVQGEEVFAAKNQPISEENIRKQLSKLGDSAFFAKEQNTILSENAFYPLKQINELRRQAVLQLEEKLLSLYENQQEKRLPPLMEEISGTTEPVSSGENVHGFSIFVSTATQLKALTEWVEAAEAETLCRVYLDGDMLVFDESRVRELCERLKNYCRLFVALPYIVRKSDAEYMQKLFDFMQAEHINGVLVRSLDGLGILRERNTGETFLCRGDAGLYTWNSGAGEQLTRLGVTDGLCIPYELNAGEQHKLLDAGSQNFEKIVYSRIPMMLTANCVLKTTGRCNKGNEDVLFLTDRYQKKFPVVRKCHHCMNIIYNSVPLSLWSERRKWLKKADLRLDFTVETEKQVTAILQAFLADGEMPAGEYTTGHERRGVE